MLDKGIQLINVEYVKQKGEEAVSKMILLKNLRNATRGNFFSITIDYPLKDEEMNIHEYAKELEQEGFIKLKECKQLEHAIFLSGILKYASN